MGDRANVYVKETEDSGVYLYTHWMGYDLPEIVRKALARADGREGDGAYLARIVFCEMVRDNLESSTGFGISTTLTDNQHPIIVLDPHRCEIAFAEEGSEKSGPYFGAMKMEDFAAQEAADYPHQQAI